MSSEMISDWIAGAKMGSLSAPITPNLKTGKLVPKSKGNIIMEIADKILPWIKQNLEGKRDKNGMLAQPSVIRGIALNVAQDFINAHEE